LINQEILDTEPLLTDILNCKTALLKKLIN